jgi:hypothetical protein
MLVGERSRTTVLPTRGIWYNPSKKRFHFVSRSFMTKKCQGVANLQATAPLAPGWNDKYKSSMEISLIKDLIFHTKLILLRRV